MTIRRRATEVQGERIPLPGTRGATHSKRTCANLGRAITQILKEPAPEILDLGPFCGETVVFLAQRGARVHVESFEPPPPIPPRKRGDPPPVFPPLRLDQPDQKFNMILAWEQGDFVPPERLNEFGTEMERVLKEGGWLFLFSLMRPREKVEAPARYRLVADDGVVREATKERRRRRWDHSTRDIERALKGFSIQSVRLQRDQMREFVALKAKPKT